MDLVTPGIGLVFWTTVTFLLVVFLLIKFAWKPVLGMINERNKSIEDALKLAETTKAEMAKLQADNERIIAEARKERDNLLKEAREMKDQMIAQAKSEASAEANKIMAAAKLSIENEKNQAMQDLKNQVATLSFEIAEKVIGKELENKKVSDEIIAESIKNLKFN
ncbi:MAG: F0F1 ATP synthase subunit B [Bacteroidales bacterium]|jgi:F-type H+-transporting ATPase subunit b|nr:F0F1 ATP synthase subunit B [Bacteroidales bacterium]MBP5723176.1 F0F1 ATP synthase subunit B [Bacteroidales bacterium]MBQ3677817.1 F0F1 ATP synthase subunit B [Bacteroidales bacterium]MBQ4216148.1 F0F1 ATP synthase subunit B [Bacteroidales bacterium]MBR4689150.1 F0F1 ATP synthase subunit B [Bacteroidales bacterium]